VASHWRCLGFSDAQMSRTNYLYSMGPDRLSPAAAAVRDELRATVRELVGTRTWKGVELI
jgi:LysR family tcuABC transcriptional regulator